MRLNGAGTLWKIDRVAATERWPSLSRPETVIRFVPGWASIGIDQEADPGTLVRPWLPIEYSSVVTGCAPDAVPVTRMVPWVVVRFCTGDVIVTTGSLFVAMGSTETST